MSKYGVFSGQYFPVFSPNTGKYGQEKTPFLETFHAVINRTALGITKKLSKNDKKKDKVGNFAQKEHVFFHF